MPQAGDILLIQYKTDPLGWIVQFFIKSHWNHSALVINNNYIFDCTSNGNKVKPIQAYTNKFLYNIKLIRFVTLTKEEKIILFEEMLKLVSVRKSGDFRFIIALIQIGLKKHPIINVCSGTISYLFHKIKITLLDTKPYYLINPEDFNHIKGVIDVSNELSDNSSNL